MLYKAPEVGLGVLFRNLNKLEYFSASNQLTMSLGQFVSENIYTRLPWEIKLLLSKGKWSELCLNIIIIIRILQSWKKAIYHVKEPLANI